MPVALSTKPTLAELLRKIRRIEIRTSRLVNELFGGRYLSTFKGRGMEFTDIREYVPGDDVRNIHWNVTARLGHPYVKRFTEERELTILIAVDVSGSTVFGTRTRFKSELAAELVSLLAFSALKNNDKVGLLLFSDRIEKYVPPRKSRSHTLRLIRDVLGFVPERTGTNIDGALAYLNRVQKKRAIVFIISDFLDAQFEKSLSITRRHHDSIAFVLEDPLEAEWPKMGRVLVEDAETGERRLVSMRNLVIRDTYQRQAVAERARRDLLFSKINMDKVVFRTHEDYVKPLMLFFKERARRFR
ncbi:MAG: DUF58 domain-containing protein [Elusimicrobia bacterium]|nr:DUF58 domain-containing protein [Candidatus Obscuribacterium magneticum]